MQCNVCCEAWPNKNINVDDKSHVCTHCKIYKGALRKFRAKNNMDRGSTPPELSDLSHCKEMLVTRAFPVNFIQRTYIDITSKCQKSCNYLIQKQPPVVFILEVLLKYFRIRCL